jgi:hypothetical protein
MTHQRHTAFVFTLLAPSGAAGIHGLRAILKNCSRHDLRCIAAHEANSTATEGVSAMTTDLEFLRKFVASGRSSGFNVPIFRLDGNTGEYRRVGNQNKTDILSGQQLAADPADTMAGWQKFEDKTPIYHIGRIADGFEIPPREALGPVNPDEKDPWRRIDLLPFWNLESREIWLFSAGNGGSRDAVANLLDAYVNKAAAHPEDHNKVPVVELATDSYENQHGKKIFVPIFEINSWIERPAAVRRILPPPIKMLELTAASEPIPEKSDQPEPVAAKAKPKRSSKNMDDEIPF